MPYSTVSSPNFTQIDPKKINDGHPGAPPSAPTSTVAPAQSRFSIQKYFLPISMAMFFMSFTGYLGITFFQYLNEYSTQSKAAFDGSLAQKQQTKPKTAAEIKIERDILDAEVTKDNLVFFDTDVLKRLGKPDGQLSNYTKETIADAQYQLAREAIVKKEVAYVSAYTIGYWTPPNDLDNAYPQDKQQQFNAIRQVGPEAIAEIESRMKKGDDPVIITKDIVNKYSTLKPVLGINGYLYSTEKDDTNIKVPSMYYHNSINKSQKLYSTIFSSKPGTVVVVNDDTGPGSAKWVVKIVSINDGKYEDYESWLEAKKKEYSKK